MRLIIFLVLAVFVAPAFAKTPVEIIPTADDAVGTRLVYALKEEIRRSESLELTFDQSKFRFQVILVTMSPSKEYAGISSIYSAVVTAYDPSTRRQVYLTQYLGHCGSEMISGCADNIVAIVSEQADSIVAASQQGGR